VVFTDAIPDEGSIEVKQPPKVAVKAKLPPTAVTKSPEPTQVPSTVAKASPPHSQSSITPTLIASLKSLYGTPEDGFITSFLLILIFFIAFKIIWR
jgi:hypothetical protein